MANIRTLLANAQKSSQTTTRSVTREQLNDLGVQYTRAGDHYKAALLYQQSAEMGDDLAMCNLGDAYLNSRGVDGDANRAAYWYLQAAKQNSKHPCGSLYAISQLTKLVEQKVPLEHAAHNLGLCYLYGYSVPKCKYNAAYYFSFDQPSPILIEEYKKLRKAPVRDPFLWAQPHPEDISTPTQTLELANINVRKRVSAL